MKTWIGLPEEDGGIPVLILIETSNHHFTFIDTLGRKWKTDELFLDPLL